MPGISLAETIAQLGVEDEWGPEITTATTLNGIPYAPYSKGDKLGRMADWTQEGKEGRDRGQRYGRNFRGQSPIAISCQCTNREQTSKYLAPVHLLYLPFKWPKTNPPSRSLTTQEHQQRLEDLVAVVAQSSEAEANAVPRKEVAAVVSKEPVKVNSAKDKDNSTIKEVVAEDEVEDLAGETTTNHKETEIPLLQFVLAGL